MVGILLLEQLVATSQGMTLRLAIAAQAGPAPTPRRPKKNQKYLGTVAGIVGSPYSGAGLGLVPPAEARLEGQAEVPVVGGVAVWSGLRLWATPNSRVGLTVYQAEAEEETTLEVGVRACTLGEEDLGVECLRCPPGSVSSVLGTPCQPCSVGLCQRVCGCVCAFCFCPCLRGRAFDSVALACWSHQLPLLDGTRACVY